jgi:hypothetical protein
MPIATVFKVLDTVILLASLLTALRLLKSGLSKQYPVLTVYLLYTAPYLAGPLVLDLKSLVYYDFWLASEPLLWILEILLVRELCSGVLAQYQGIRTMGRWMIYGGMVISIAISLLTLLPNIRSSLSQRSRILAMFTGMARGVNLALAVFLLLMLFLVSRYPVRLSRNVLLNTGVFTLFFLCNTLNAILSTVFDLRLGLKAATLLATLSCGCAIVWLLFLTPAGEKVESHWPHFSPDYEDYLLRQLDSLNRALGGSPDIPGSDYSTD